MRAQNSNAAVVEALQPAAAQFDAVHQPVQKIAAFTHNAVHHFEFNTLVELAEECLDCDHCAGTGSKEKFRASCLLPALGISTDCISQERNDDRTFSLCPFRLDPTNKDFFKVRQNRKKRVRIVLLQRQRPPSNSKQVAETGSSNNWQSKEAELGNTNGENIQITKCVSVFLAPYEPGNHTVDNNLLVSAGKFFKGVVGVIVADQSKLWRMWSFQI